MKSLFVLGTIVLTGCGVTNPAPVVTVTAPPPVTVTPSPTVNEYQSVLEEVWDETSYSDRQDLCYAFTTYPQLTWQSFDEGADGTVPKQEFFTFFEKECGY